MSKPTDIRVVETRMEVEQLRFRTPLKFGGRVMSEAEIVNVVVRVETASGKSAEGFGSMPLGNVWAWPSKVVEPPQAAAAMRLLAEKINEAGSELRELAHPLDHIHSLSPSYAKLAAGVVEQLHVGEPMPALPILVAASPFDAAIHDAFGKANGISAFNGLGEAFVAHDLSHYLDDRFAGEYLDRYTLRKPKPRMPLYHLVGALDPITESEIVHHIDDGLPETLGEWIAFNGLTHLKIKLNGDDIRWDSDRVLAVEKVAVEAQAKRGCGSWWYSLDFNERCENAGYLLDFLRRIEAAAPAALNRIQYIEQPTHRDLKTHRQQRMHEVARIKPVVIDESLVDFESLLLAREMGYSGVALKACKGHTEALLMAAAAQKFGMFLCVQDLTCPGASFLHSAELAARIPGVAAIEGNGRQYCPAGNVEWSKRFPAMFNITDGTLGTSCLDGPGLGH